MKNMIEQFLEIERGTGEDDELDDGECNGQREEVGLTE